MFKAQFEPSAAFWTERYNNKRKKVSNSLFLDEIYVVGSELPDRKLYWGSTARQLVTSLPALTGYVSGATQVTRTVGMSD